MRTRSTPHAAPRMETRQLAGTNARAPSRRATSRRLSSTGARRTARTASCNCPRRFAFIRFYCRAAARCCCAARAVCGGCRVRRRSRLPKRQVKQCGLRLFAVVSVPKNRATNANICAAMLNLRAGSKSSRDHTQQSRSADRHFEVCRHAHAQLQRFALQLQLARSLIATLGQQLQRKQVSGLVWKRGCHRVPGSSQASVFLPACRLSSNRPVLMTTCMRKTENQQLQ